MYLSRGEKTFEVFNYIFLTIVTLCFLVPFLTVMSTSLISVEEWARRGAFVLIPEKVDFSAYQVLLGSKSMVFNAYRVTLFRVIVGTFLNLVFTTLGAYVLARRNLPRTYLIDPDRLFPHGIQRRSHSYFYCRRRCGFAW